MLGRANVCGQGLGWRLRRATSARPVRVRAIVSVVTALMGLTIGVSADADPSCPPTSGPAGANYRGQALVWPNFSDQDLTNADFSNAHLTSPNFIGANLTGANFRGAKIDAENAINPDFSFANLTNACFIGATIGDPNVPSYFTDSTLTCADFSQVSPIDRNDALTSAKA